jgi:hypothetical protein
MAIPTTNPEVPQGIGIPPFRSCAPRRRHPHRLQHPRRVRYPTNRFLPLLLPGPEWRSMPPVGRLYRPAWAETYTVNVADNGDVGASAEVFINFGGALDQTDQVTPSGGFNCTVSRGDKGINATVHCTAQQLSPKTTTPIVVHGRGMSPGAGQLVMTVNSDPGVQFDNKTQQLNVKIT